MKKLILKKIVRFNLLLLVIFAGLIFTDCGKSKNVSWVYYDETICADQWAASGTNEVLKENITKYFADKGVKIYELEIFADRTPDSCSDCNCKTGRRIKAKVAEKQVGDMKAENFYQ